MSIFKTIAVVAPKIGTILGALLGGQNDNNDPNAPLRVYTVFLGGSEVTKKVDFYLDDDRKKIILSNESEDPVAFTVPAVNGNDPTTVSLGRRSKYDATKAFGFCGTHAIDTIEITAPINAVESEDGQSKLTVTAGGSVTTGSLLGRSIGFDMRVSINEDSITIALEQGNSNATLFSVELNTRGTTGNYKIYNVEMGEDNQITLGHSLSLLIGDVVDVSISVEYLQSTNTKEANRKRHNIKTLSDAEILRLKNAICINPRKTK